MKAIYLRASGVKSYIRPKNNGRFTSDELRQLVGGDYAIAYIELNRVIVVNDRHRIDELPLNIRATEIVSNNGLSEDIHGDALVCESKYIK